MIIALYKPGCAQFRLVFIHQLSLDLNGPAVHSQFLLANQLLVAVLTAALTQSIHHTLFTLKSKPELSYHTHLLHTTELISVSTLHPHRSCSSLLETCQKFHHLSDDGVVYLSVIHSTVFISSAPILSLMFSHIGCANDSDLMM